MIKTTFAAIAETALVHVTGAGNGVWNDSMSNGCGDGTRNLPNGTWRQACVDHDHAYFNGGSAADRLGADRKLRSDMISQGASLGTAETYYLGVRFGAAKRWGQVPLNPGSH